MKTLQLRCPKCRELAAIPGGARLADRIACQHCGATSILSNGSGTNSETAASNGHSENAFSRPSPQPIAATTNIAELPAGQTTEVHATGATSAEESAASNSDWIERARSLGMCGVEKTQSALRSCGQIGDVLFQLGAAAVRSFRCGKQSRDALLKMGEACLTKEMGDAELRQAVRVLEGRIESLQAAGSSTRAMQAERRGLLIRLAKSQLESNHDDSDAVPARRASADLDESQRQLSAARAAFAQINLQQWLHLAACVGVIWLLGSMLPITGRSGEESPQAAGLEQYYEDEGTVEEAVTTMSDNATAIAEHLRIGNLEAAERLLEANRYEMASEAVLPVLEAWVMLSRVDTGGPNNYNAVANQGDSEPAYQVALKKLRAAVQLDPQLKSFAADAVYSAVIDSFKRIAQKGQAISSNDNFAFVRQAKKFRDPQVRIPEELSDRLLFSCYSVDLTRQQLGIRHQYDAFAMQLGVALDQGNGPTFTTGSWVDLTRYANELDPQAIHRWEERLHEAQELFEKSDCYLSSFLIENAILVGKGAQREAHCDADLQFLIDRLEQSETQLAAERILVALVCFGEQHKSTYLADLARNDDARLAKLMKLFAEKADKAKLQSVRNFLSI